MIEEQWKPIEGYENYQVSNFGEVKSLGNNKKRKEKLLSPGKNGKGYLFVSLSKNGVGKPFTIHRLVYETFVGEIPPKWDINHLDENKENNHLENLEACSHEKNCGWGNRNKKIAATLINHPQRSKAVEAIDKVTGKVIYVFPSTMEAERQGFDSGAVSKCCRNCYSRPVNNLYKGFIWRYKE